MDVGFTRKEAMSLLRKYNSEPFHILHAPYGGRRHAMVCRKTRIYVRY